MVVHLRGKIHNSTKTLMQRSVMGVAGRDVIQAKIETKRKKNTTKALHTKANKQDTKVIASTILKPNSAGLNSQV